MTAHTLAQQLLKGPDVLVTVAGYEGGVDEITTVVPPRPLHLRVNRDDSYYGDHSYHTEDRNARECCFSAAREACVPPEDMVQAIHLCR